MIENPTQQAFISYSSLDKEFVSKLVTHLKMREIAVWYDDWEIDFGDSIVEKVFSGLSKSDALLIVLSNNSIKSRWVAEELNVSVMRRLSAQDIRIIPIKIDDCEVPDSLNHIRYADFSDEFDEPLLHLVELLKPAVHLWEKLDGLYCEFSILIQIIMQMPIDTNVGDKLGRLHNILLGALDVRVEIESRRHGVEVKELDHLYKGQHELSRKIAYLRDIGIDARSAVWHALVYYNSMLAHARRDPDIRVSIFAEMIDETGYFAQSVHTGLPHPPIFQEEYDAIEGREEAVRLALKELESVASLLCKSEFKRREPYQKRS